MLNVISHVQSKVVIQPCGIAMDFGKIHVLKRVKTILKRKYRNYSNNKRYFINNIVVELLHNVEEKGCGITFLCKSINCVPKI